MSTRRILDSSPVHITTHDLPESSRRHASPGIDLRKTLKRSASRASLPTPPRTHSDRKRRVAHSPSSDSDCFGESEDESAGTVARKGGCTLGGTTEDDDAFWAKHDRLTGGSGSPSTHRPGDRPLRSPDLAPHLVKKAEAFASGASSLASPPPSHRQVTKPTAAAALPLTPQQTCKRPVVKRMPLLLEESPDNPFLDSGSMDTPNKSRSVEERRRVTYVFRGKRIEFNNPYYIESGLRPSKATERRYKLPAEHEDFVFDPRCQPRQLFTALDRQKFSSCYDSDDDDSDSASDAEDMFSTPLGPRKTVARRLFDPSLFI